MSDIQKANITAPQQMQPNQPSSPITTSSGFKFNPGATTPSSSILHPEEASQLDSIF